MQAANRLCYVERMQPCAHCRKPFMPRRARHRFCGRACAAAATRPVLTPLQQVEALRLHAAGATCATVARRFACSKETVARLARLAGQSRGRGTPRATGATHRDGRGYLLVKVDGRWRAQHGVVLEAKLGRRLRPGEHAHHLNGRRDDNRPANLAVRTRAEHGREHHAPPAARLRAVRRDRDRGLTLSEIAARHGVGVTTVHRYLRLDGTPKT